jgi:hypothetical protein
LGEIPTKETKIMSNDFDNGVPVGKIIGFSVLALVVIMAIGWLAQGNDFFLYKVFAPKYEDVRRETYTHTRSYRQGSVQRLNTLCTQVHDADEGHKPMVKDVIAHEFADWNSEDVPDYLRGCLADARAK